MSLHVPYARNSAAAAAICATVRASIVLAGWSETARRSGVDRTALHRAFPPERGGRMPSFSMVIAVADALGLRLSIEGQP
jgi:DNA-binding phage protein